MDNRETYQPAELDIIRFVTEYILTNSGTEHVIGEDD